MRATALPRPNAIKRKLTVYFLYAWPHERGRGLICAEGCALAPFFAKQLHIIDEMLEDSSFTYKPGVVLVCDDGGDLEIKRQIFEEMIIEAKKEKAVVFISSHDRLSPQEHAFARAKKVKIESPDEPACWLAYSNAEDGISPNAE